LGLLNRGDAGGAIAAFQQALDLQPRSTAGHVYLALGLLRAQRGREAAAALSSAKAIDAKQANDIITKAFHMPPGPDNIDMVIRQAAGQ
jgi:thioredoxin-like negative regulator of GroEL